MDDYTPRIAFSLLLFRMLVMDGATPSCGGVGGAINPRIENFSVPIGGTLTIIVNISVNNLQADFLYLGKGSPLMRLIRLLKGEGGNGTCYNEMPECKENYALRHSGDKTINIIMREVNKSMEDFYRLYPYCLGSNHNCSTDQPLKSFVLTIKDETEPTKVITVETDSGPTEPFSSGKSNATQVPTITGSGSKEPVPEGNTNYVVIIGVVFAVIIVAIVIVFLVVVYVHRMHLLVY